MRPRESSPIRSLMRVLNRNQRMSLVPVATLISARQVAALYGRDRGVETPHRRCLQKGSPPGLRSPPSLSRGRPLSTTSASCLLDGATVRRQADIKSVKLPTHNRRTRSDPERAGGRGRFEEEQPACKCEPGDFSTGPQSCLEHRKRQRPDREERGIEIPVGAPSLQRTPVGVSVASKPTRPLTRI
jgi:hypothetical protein